MGPRSNRARVAVVDLGSTAVRLLLARIVPGAGYRVLVEERVLSARDEARLGVDAALNRLRFKNGIVADLGGSSLQISRVRRRRVVSTASLPPPPGRPLRRSHWTKVQYRGMYAVP